MGDLIELSAFQLTQRKIPLKELRKWNLFDTIGDNFLQNVRLAHAHYKFGFFVTTDDNVYAFGTGRDGSLGPGSITKASLPVKIDILCGQNVKEFVIGLHTFFAITADGRVFAWGSNRHGQLGVGNGETLVSTPTLIKFEEGVKIAQISMGYCHTLALTTDTGEVFSWGWNDLGQLGVGNKTNQNKPSKITTGLGNIRVKQISCSYYSSFALSESGEVYSWGANLFGELGIENATPTTVPTKIPIDKPIKKIANGFNHTLLLTTSGEIYACGYNAEEQLGTGNTTSLSVQTKISADLIFDDICCMPWSYQSSAKAADKIFVWGKIHEGIICSKPIELAPNLSNFPHPPVIFGGQAQVMYRSICAPPHVEHANSIRETLETAIDGAGTDVEFKAGVDLIRVHKSILILRSDYFSRKFSQDWKKLDSIELEDIKRDTFYAFLYHLYTEQNYFSDGDIDQILDLMKLAAMYGDGSLKEKCETILQKQITLENVFTIYVAAKEYNSNCLRDAAFNLGVANWEEISNTGALDKADLSNQDLKDFMKAWATQDKGRKAEGENSNKPK